MHKNNVVVTNPDKAYGSRDDLPTSLLLAAEATPGCLTGGRVLLTTSGAVATLRLIGRTITDSGELFTTTASSSA